MVPIDPVRDSAAFPTVTIAVTDAALALVDPPPLTLLTPPPPPPPDTRVAVVVKEGSTYLLLKEFRITGMKDADWKGATFAQTSVPLIVTLVKKVGEIVPSEYLHQQIKNKKEKTYAWTMS